MQLHGEDHQQENEQSVSPSWSEPSEDGLVGTVEAPLGGGWQGQSIP